MTFSSLQYNQFVSFNSIKTSNISLKENKSQQDIDKFMTKYEVLDNYNVNNTILSLTLKESNQWVEKKDLHPFTISCGSSSYVLINYDTDNIFSEYTFTLKYVFSNYGNVKLNYELLSCSNPINIFSDFYISDTTNIFGGSNHFTYSSGITNSNIYGTTSSNNMFDITIRPTIFENPSKGVLKVWVSCPVIYNCDSSTDNNIEAFGNIYGTKYIGYWYNVGNQSGQISFNYEYEESNQLSIFVYYEGNIIYENTSPTKNLLQTYTFSYTYSTSSNIFIQFRSTASA